MSVKRLPNSVSAFARADAFVGQLRLSTGEKEVGFAHGGHAGADLAARTHNAGIGWNLKMKEEEKERGGLTRESKQAVMEGLSK